MKWSEFIKAELEIPSLFDNAEIAMSNSITSGPMPLIAQMSVSVLNRFIRAGEKRLVIVFPEGKWLPFLFLIAKLLTDVFSVNSEICYDPSIFIPGEKVKFQNCVVEYMGMEADTKGITRICVKTGDSVVNKMPLDSAPYFQQADTNRRLTKDRVFSRAKSAYRQQRSHSDAPKGSYQIIDTLKNNMTHFSGSIFSVISQNRMQELLESTTINHEKLCKLLLMGKADEDGNVDIKSAGQLTGNPAIVYAKDLYAILETAQRDIPVKMLFIDGTDTSVVNKQLDAIDELTGCGFPIIYTTDTATSFELEQLEIRGFYIWRWDKDTLLDRLVQDRMSMVGKRVNSCAKNAQQYKKCTSEQIDTAFSSLLSCRQLVDEATANISANYSKLLSLAFRCMRQVRNFENNERQRYLASIKECRDVDRAERKYNADTLINAMDTAAENLAAFVCSKDDLPKVAQLKAHLLEHKSVWKRVCLIVADDANTEQCINFWLHFLLSNHMAIQLHIAHQDEYVHDQLAQYDATIICGWLKREKMQKALFCNISEHTTILHYGYESRWKDGCIRWWNRIQNKGDNYRFISRAIPELDRSYIAPADEIIPADLSNDELEDISLVIQQAQYKSYIACGGTRELTDTVEAIPISFVGNCFAFFKQSHKLIDVTDIVLGKRNTIRIIEPENLSTGNFIVVREAAKDILRELADEILGNSGMSDARELAAKWKDALEMESLFCDVETLCAKIQSAGCKKNRFTIRQWIKNDDRIIPQYKEDVRYIAAATQDQVLGEMLETVFEAGKNVQRAHVKAGQALSAKLKQQIAYILTEKGIDPYNIWDPITLYIDGIGNAKVLKVIDKSAPVLVDTSNVNRIIEEY